MARLAFVLRLLCVLPLAPPVGALSPALSAPLRQRAQLAGAGGGRQSPAEPVPPLPAASPLAFVGGGARRGGAAGLLDVGAEQTPTKVTYQSFGSRLSESVGNFVFGIVLIIFSFPVLWLNESRNAKFESLVARGKDECRAAKGDVADKDNTNWLVHLEGERMRGAAQVSDREFNVAMNDNCVRLRAEVEVFQYIQHEHREEREKFGGGKETRTTYTYSTAWSGTWNDSGSFEDKSKHNSKPQGLDVGTRCTENSRVEYGDAFLLPRELVQQCHDFTPANPRLSGSVQHQESGTTFVLHGGSFCYFVDGDSKRHYDKVGDARVRFDYVPDGPASVLALQVESVGDARDTFLPYRLVPKPCCGAAMDDTELKIALRERAELSKGDLASLSQVGSGCIWCLCCACNLVNMCCAGAMVPEIYHLMQGSRSRSALFGKVTSEMKLWVWLFRVVGALMLFMGLRNLFSPFLTFIKVIPFLGPILSSLGSALISVVCLVLTLAIATLVICLAYLCYHPLLALLYGVLAAAIVLIPIAVLAVVHH